MMVILTRIGENSILLLSLCLHTFKFPHIKLVANVILLVAWSYDSFYIKYHGLLCFGDITSGRGTDDGVLHGPLACYGIIIQK